MPLPLLLILGGALLGLMDVRNSTLDKVSERDEYKRRVDELAADLEAARASDASDIEAIRAELDKATRELAGLQAGAKAREKKASKSPKADPPADPAPDVDPPAVEETPASENESE